MYVACASHLFSLPTTTSSGLGYIDKLQEVPLSLKNLLPSPQRNASYTNKADKNLNVKDKVES